MAGHSGPAILLALKIEQGGLETAVGVILEVKAKCGTGDKVVAFFRSILPETRAHDGRTSVDTLQNSAWLPSWKSKSARSVRHSSTSRRGARDTVLVLPATRPSRSTKVSV